MKPHEARVLIIDDREMDRLALRMHIEEQGGVVAGEIDSLEQATAAIADVEFRHITGNPNVVLIDGNLSPDGEQGTEGMYLFLNGYERGLLHRVDAQADTIGAVAIGCSISGSSDVGSVTGGNFFPTPMGIDSGNDSDALDWARLLETHPAEPDWIERGLIERKVWARFGFAETLGHLIDGDEELVTVVSATVTDSDGDNNSASKELRGSSVMTLKEFVDTTGEWQLENEDGSLSVGQQHLVNAVIAWGDHHFVISHTSKVSLNRFSGRVIMSMGGDSDRILTSRLGEMPASYLLEHGIEV